MISLPGCFTPSEGFLALKSGAQAVKLFPGELITTAVAKAVAAVVPRGTRLLVTGGVSVEELNAWRSVVQGFGIGSSIYKPGLKREEVGRRARALTDAMRRFVDGSHARSS